MKNWKKLLFIILVFFGANCKKPYFPPATSSAGSYLVVEGVINSGSDSTVIKLSRTVSLLTAMVTNPVLNAVVTVESDQNNSYPLLGTSNGNYVAPGLNLDVSRKYRLRIKTGFNHEYLSDLVAVKNTPPIDSIGYTVQSDGIQILLNTHDPGNNTRYYRWEYKETWQFNAKYGSQYVTDGVAIKPRSPYEQVTTCWANNTSNTIVLGSSAKLTQDVIAQNPITQVASTSEKLETKYSILVKQYALTSDAFAFWTNLKKNTEQLGSIFDAQPSNTSGNIHSVTNPSEIVIGYISVTNTQQKRIFISNAQLPRAWVPVYPYDCELDSALFCKPRTVPCQNDVAQHMIPIGSAEIPFAAITSGPAIIGYLGTSRECADCTIRGNNKPPSFWK